LVRSVPISDHLIRYTLAIVRQTRVGERGVPDFAREQLAWGAGPRAVQFMILGAKARALIHGRAHVEVDDIKALAHPVLRHRIVVNFAAESDGVTTDQVIDRLLEVTPTHEDQLLHDDRFQKIFAS
jgi:MoxR-like ATPase